MFLFKKFISHFLLPPGFIIVLLFISGIWLLRRRNRVAAVCNLLLAILLWLVASNPVAEQLMAGLERGLTIPRSLQGDVIVLLGGGTYDKVQDLSGQGAPSEDMLARIVTAVRVQRKTHLPVLVTGGSVYAGRAPEAQIVQRFLVDLGVPRDKIIMEDSSRDTVENAIYTAAICARRGFAKPLLVTSAYHMRRAVIAFRKQGMTVQPLPAQFKTDKQNKRNWIDYLPSAAALQASSVALHEYIGLLFYRLTLK